MDSIVVFIPCLNEEPTIAKVVTDFRRELPEAEVVVVDNDSNDNSRAEASQAGAKVLVERRRGKGYVVQSMFQATRGAVLVMVDGDDTYPASRVHELVSPILRREAEMVIGSRMMADSGSRFQALNRLGNLFYQRMTNAIFGTRLTDVLSGYRAFSPELVQSLPIFVTGFEVEAELTIKCLERGYRILEVPIGLKPRQPGSRSKIRIVGDGLRILATILALFRDYKPLTFFGGLGVILLIPGFVALVWTVGNPTYGVLPSPSWVALLELVSVLAGGLLIAMGLILHTVKRRFQELEYYLRLLIQK